MVNDQAEHVFVEPFVGHDEVAAVDALSPAVLDHPFLRLPVLVQVDGHQGHGVRRAAGEGLDALLLVHAELGAEQRAVVVIIHVEVAPLAVEILADVAREVEHRAVLDRGDGHLLDVLDGQVDVGPVLPVVDVAVVVDLIELVELAARVVHQHDVVIAQVVAHELLVERLRSVFLRLDGVALGVAAGPGELRGGLAQRQGQHAVDGLEHLGLPALQVGRAFPVRGKFAQLQAEFFQLKADQVGHARRVVAAVGLDHHFRRDDAILHEQVGDAGELPAVAEGVLEEPLHHLVVHRLLARVDDALQEEVRFLQLVPEEGVVLGELELTHVVLRDRLGPQDVQPGEEPAAARRLLVGDALALDLVGEVGVVIVQALAVDGQRVDVVVAERVADRPVGGRLLVRLLELLQHLGRDPALLPVGGERAACRQGHCQEIISVHGYRLFFKNCCSLLFIP